MKFRTHTAEVNRFSAVAAKPRVGGRVTPGTRTHDAVPRDLHLWSTVIEAPIDGQTGKHFHREMLIGLKVYKYFRYRLSCTAFGDHHLLSQNSA